MPGNPSLRRALRALAAREESGKGRFVFLRLGGQGSFGQADNGAGIKQDLLSLFVGPFVKWFPSGREFALRFDGGYEYRKLSSGNADATVTGLGLNVELMAYF